MRGTLRFTVAIVGIASLSRPGDLDVRVVREGVSVNAPRPDRVADVLVALVESSSVNSTGYVHPSDRWKSALRASTLVHVRFDPPRAMRVKGSNTQEWQRPAVHEILLVVPRTSWPDHVLLKGQDGVLSVTKYSPCTLAELVTQAGLGLSDPRYKSLLEACAAEK